MKSNHLGIENFMITNEIVGKGGMASVYLCQDSRFVAKKLSLYTIYPWIELYIMESPQFRHKHINQGIVKSKFDGVYIYQQRALGSLKQLKNFHLTNVDIFQLMKQLVDAVSFLHFQGIIHCDIKPSNILIDDGMGEMFQLKITDFGLSTKKNWFHQAKIGSAKFRAPEANEEGWDERIDIWGLGHILYFLLTKQELFGTHYMKENKDFEGLNTIPSGHHKDLWDLCKRMLEPDPNQRIEMKKLWSFFNLYPYPAPPAPSARRARRDLSISHSLECTEINYHQEIKRIVKCMVDAGEEKHRKFYRSIAKQMVKREKMPTSTVKCFDEVNILIKILEKVIL